MAELVLYRWADYDTPLWVNPNRSSGRWHVRGSDPTQYWSLHPLGPWAERIRSSGMTTLDDLRSIRSRIWAARYEFDPGSVPEIDFSTCGQFGLRAEDLVSDDPGACQAAGARLRDRYEGIIVPSAALPGAANVVLFGARAMSPYAMRPPDPDHDMPTALASEQGCPPDGLLPLVCHRGAVHRGLDAWEKGLPGPIVSVTYPLPPEPR